MHLVTLTDAEAAPALLADVLAEGRVLVDRDGRWPALRARRPAVALRAAEADDALLARGAAFVAEAHARAKRA